MKIVTKIIPYAIFNTAQKFCVEIGFGCKFFLISRGRLKMN